MRTGYVWQELYGWHDTGTHAGFFPSGYPLQPYENYESSASKVRLASLVEASGLADRLERLRPVPLTIADLALVHDREYLERIAAASANGGGDAGDGTTPFGRGGFEIAALAAGGTTAALGAVLRGEVRNAYALVRPPGHHAEPAGGMGYCLVNNLAVAIRAMREREGLGRVAVVDYDVHHGNGTQAVFWNDPQTLTISIHQEGLYPEHTGTLDERGGAGAEGTNLNVPLPDGSGNGAYLDAFDRAILPALERFRPEVILVASGFDAGAADPISHTCVSAAGYRAIARRLVDAAERLCDGRLVASHEGGYSPVYVPFCGLAVIEELSGVETGVVDPFASTWDVLPAQRLEPWQVAAVDHAVAALEHIPEPIGRPAVAT